MNVLITGGAGFIGSHLADRLLTHGHSVRAFDNLDLQVHPSGERPSYLDPRVELVVGDVRDADHVHLALAGIDTVVHFAAAVGVGQSMETIVHYTSVNALGTAVLLEELSAVGRRQIRKLLVASSMSVYGEGGLNPVDERRPLQPASIYAIGKRDQEEMCLVVGKAIGVSTVALRFFNVYGARQALTNPYTGVAAIFAARLMDDLPPVVFEDGKQMRDFVHVSDVARCCYLALQSHHGNVSINVGTGKPVTVLQVAETIAAGLHKQDAGIAMPGTYRDGDVRHCYANPQLAEQMLGFRANVGFGEGMVKLLDWLKLQELVRG